MADDDSLRGRLAALLAPSQDNNASPQGRDEDPTTVGREEFREEADAQDIAATVEEYYRNPLVRVPVQNFSADVTEPGVSVAVDTPDDTDVPTVPESARQFAGMALDDALEQWLSSSYIDGFSFDADVGDLLQEMVKDRRGRRGTSMVEHAYDDPRERERLMGLRPLKVETTTAYTREGKRIALRPDDEPGSFDTVAIHDLGDYTRDKAPRTPAGKTAAIAQFDEVFGSEDREEIPFALDDLSISAYDADTGQLFGEPDSATIINRAKSLRKKLRHVDQSVVNTAFGNVIAQVDSESEDVVKAVRDNLDVNVKDRGDDADPDSVSVTNAPVDISEVDASVPQITDHIKQEIEFVLAAMPTPLYRVGFAGDINRDVTAEQGEDYRDAVKRERRRLESDLRPMLAMKARELLYGDAHADESLEVTPRLRIRPADSESPLRDEEFDASEFSQLMSGLSTAAGPKGGATAILPEEVIVDTVLDMDAEEVLGDEPAPDAAPAGQASTAVREAFEEFSDADLAGGPFADIPVLPDDLQTLSQGWLIRWAEWVAADRPDIPESERLTPVPYHAALDWNPELHPRDPETGQFVERPFSVPDDAPDFSDQSVAETLQYLDDNGADVSAILNPDSSVTVDGVPDDVSGLDDLPDGGSDGDAGDDGSGGETDGDSDAGRVVQKSEVSVPHEDLEPGDRLRFDDGSTVEITEVAQTDDGQSVAFSEDGFYTDAAFDTGDSGSELTPEGETIQESLGVQTVNLSGLDENARQDLVDVLRAEFDRDESLRENFGTVGAVTTTPPSDLRNDDDRTAAAAFQGSTRTLYVNPDSFNDELAPGSELNLGGVALATDREKTIQHELGHARHFFDGAEEYGDARDRGLSDSEQELAVEAVSNYAAYNAMEFVAEVYTAKRNGAEFGEDVESLYRELNGPEVDADGN